MRRIIFTLLISFSLIVSSNTEIYYGPDPKIDYGYKEYAEGNFKATFNKVLKLAKNGHIEGQVRLAYLYHFGQGVSKNVKEAIYWYKKSALQGHPLAAGNLAGFYKDGTILNADGNKDYDSAIYWYKKASLAQGQYKGKVDESALKDLKDIEMNLLPSNSQVTENGWRCNSGFKRSGNNCIKGINVPPNAYASGSGWKCNSGFTKSNNTCIQNPVDNQVYSAASGSGFAVTSDGYVITNYHVIKGCTDVYIHDKGKSILSTIVTFDPNNDIALLKGNFKPRNFYPLSRESTKLLTEVYVAGHPFGRDISTSVKVTRGIVSSLTGVANNFSNLQIDASLQPGNSGGPIMNDKGNVIGVAVAKLDLDTIVEDYGVVPENVNFGVKANVVINIMESENIKLPKPNLKSMPMSELSEMITDGTYYLSCWMTMAQINKMRETKVIFKSLN